MPGGPPGRIYDRPYITGRAALFQRGEPKCESDGWRLWACWPGWSMTYCAWS